MPELMNTPDPTLLEDLGNGEYRVHLYRLQEGGASVNTKEFLLPLLRDTRYSGFEVPCKHVPSWLVLEIFDCRLPGEIKRQEDGSMTVRIRRSHGCG